jgi:hypothetical protein
MVWYDIDNKRRFKDEFAEKCNGCNACGGTGKIMKHSYDLEKHEEDVMAVSDIPDNFKCYYLIVNENVFISKKQAQDEKSDFYFDGNVKKKLNKLGITDGYLVTVDLHSGEKET